MLLAHKIELRPTPEQAEYLLKACGSKRHCFNNLLDYFSQEGVKWSKKAAYAKYKELRSEYEWYSEVSQRITRNVVDDLDSAFKHFFRRVKAGDKPGFPRFKRKGVKDSFALREKEKFTIDGRILSIEKLKTKIKMRQRLRFSGTPKQVTISLRAGKFFASILVDTEDYDPQAPQDKVVGVDFGLKDLAVCSDGKRFGANQKLKASLKALAKQNRALSRKQRGSNRRAKAKLALAKTHFRIARQRQAALHEVSHYLTSRYKRIVIEDLNVSGMMKNRRLSRAISDAGWGELRRQLEYKAKLRNCEVVVADRFFPSSKIVNCHGHKLDSLSLNERVVVCPECGRSFDRDYNAALNLKEYSAETFKPTDKKRTEETCETLDQTQSEVDDDVNLVTFVN